MYANSVQPFQELSPLYFWPLCEFPHVLRLLSSMCISCECVLCAMYIMYFFNIRCVLRVMCMGILCIDYLYVRLGICLCGWLEVNTYKVTL